MRAKPGRNTSSAKAISSATARACDAVARSSRAAASANPLRLCRRPLVDALIPESDDEPGGRYRDKPGGAEGRQGGATPPGRPWIASGGGRVPARREARRHHAAVAAGEAGDALHLGVREREIEDADILLDA